MLQNISVDQTVFVNDAFGNVIPFSLRTLLCRRGSDLYEILRKMGFEAEFKDAEFENILARMLARVPDSLDKRQGSIIYDALAPAAVEFTEAYIEREANRALSYASLSTGEWLDMRVFEHGVSRMPASAAIRYGFFWADEDKTEYFDNVPISGRYSVPNDALNFIVTERVASGIYKLCCEEAGEIGNQPYSGIELLPVEYLPGLAVVELGDPIIPGEDEESDAALFDRFVKYITRPPFGGNRADYEEYFRKIDGIGSVRLYRADPEKGHVTAYVLGADWEIPSAELLDNAQTKIDPIVNKGEGIGMAPMAHIVHVNSAKAAIIDIGTELVLIRGWTIEQVQSEVNAAVESYLLDLRRHWADYVSLDSPEYVDSIVRIAQLESCILDVDGIADLKNTRINTMDENLCMDRDEVPYLGTCSLKEA